MKATLFLNPFFHEELLHMEYYRSSAGIETRMTVVFENNNPVSLSEMRHPQKW